MIGERGNVAVGNSREIYVGVEASEVAIVGAGPVGLCLAELLGRQGIDVTVFEREPSVGHEWRASTFHAATLELLQQLELGQALVDRGNPAPIEQHRTPEDGIVAEFDYGLLADVTPFPFRLQCPQQELVRLMLDRQRDTGNFDLRLGTTFEVMARGASDVELTLEDDRGLHVHRARLVVGADGAASQVRKSLGISFDGRTYLERFLQMSTPFDVREALPDLRNANYIYDPHDNMQLLRLPSAWKVTIPIRPDESPETAVAPAACARRVQRILRTPDELPLDGARVYTVHQRVAARFTDAGMVALCGDAAHVNSPVGGMGLNSGIHDAFVLSEHIVRVFEARPAEARQVARRELGAYSQARRSVATDVVQQITERNTRQLAEAEPARRARQFEELRDIASDATRARERLLRSSMLSMTRPELI